MTTTITPRKESNFQEIEGPDQLADYLRNTLKNHIAVETIVYKHGAQEAIIKLDLREQPGHIYFNDLQDRPASNRAKEIIAQFLYQYQQNMQNKSKEAIQKEPWYGGFFKRPPEVREESTMDKGNRFKPGRGMKS